LHDQEVILGNYLKLEFRLPALPICRHACNQEGHRNAGGRRDEARPELAELIALFHEMRLIACSRSWLAQNFAIGGASLSIVPFGQRANGSEVFERCQMRGRYRLIRLGRLSARYDLHHGLMRSWPLR
jgi:hypothetical protein